MMLWKKIVRILNPAIDKRHLLLVAAFFWGIVSYRICFLFIEMMQSTTLKPFVVISAGIIAYLFFFHFVFFKLVRRHVKRIVMKSKKACVFGFFDWRSYGLFLFMVGLGIVSVKFNLFGPGFLSILFLKLLLCLATSTVYFLYYWIRFSYATQKFTSP